MIERSPYKIKRGFGGTYLVVDPAYPESESSCYVRGRFVTQIEAINYSTQLWEEDIRAAESKALTGGEK